MLNKNKFNAIFLGLAATISICSSGFSQSIEDALQLSQQKQFPQALQIMESLYLQNPEDPRVINNLAVIYNQRGVASQTSNTSDYNSAINDYRRTLYILNYEWPDGANKPPEALQNAKVAQGNLELALKNLKINFNDPQWHLKEAQLLRSKGALREAFVEYAWATRLNPKESSAWEAQGDIYTVRRRYSKALKAYQQAINNNPNPSANQLVKLATAYQQDLQLAKAAELFTRALTLEGTNNDALLGMEQLWVGELKINPNNASAHANLGTVYQKLKRFTEAQREYQEALKREPNNIQTKYNFASLFADQGNKQQAIAVYDDILKQAPGDARALEAKTELLTAGATPEQSYAALEKMLATSPNKESIFNSMVEAAKKTNKPELLARAYQVFADTVPQNGQAQYDAGLILHQMKDYPKAVSYYQRSIKLNPTNADAYANLGSAYQALNQNQQAKEALNKALQFNPKLTQAKQLLDSINNDAQQALVTQAVTALNSERYSEAVGLYTQLIQQFPNQADYQYQYALALQGAEQFDKSLAAYDKAISLNPKNADFYYNKARLLNATGKLAQAKPVYEKALSINANLTDAKNELAELNQVLSNQQAQQLEQQLNGVYQAYEQKQYPKAVQLADSLLKADPKNARAYYYKGLALEELKQPPKAVEAYKKAVQLSPSLNDAWYALAVLYDTLGQKPQAKSSFQTFINQSQSLPADDEYLQYAKTRIQEL